MTWRCRTRWLGALPDRDMQSAHRFSYLVTRENARRIILEPALIEAGRQHLGSRLPEFSAGAEFWRALLDEGPEAVAETLASFGESGDYARETAPAFGGLPARTRAQLLAIAAFPLDEPGNPP